jgi:4-amino-4-deoxy-L-arabinose transferase-like glycosyltransferase
VITALLLGGLLLLLLGQAIPQLPPGHSRAGIWVLQALGLVTFLIGGKTAVHGALPPWLAQPLTAISTYFGVQIGQSVLLLLAPAFTLLAFCASGDGLLAYSAPVAATAWLLAITCAVGGAARPGQEAALHIPVAEILFTAVLFGAALFLRSIGTEFAPPTFSGDEGSAGLSAVEFLNGNANNIFAVGWFDFPALYFALQGLLIGALGQTFTALRLFSALGGALTVVATYWLGRITLGKWVGALAAIFLAASHYHIHMSRIGLNNIWDGFFAATAVAGLWLGWRSGRRLGFIVAGVALGLGQYFYVSIRLMPLLFLIWAVAALIVQPRQFRERLPGLILSAFIAAVIFLPLGLFYAGHPDQFAARMRFVSVLGEWMDTEMARTGVSEARILLDQTVSAAAGIVIEPLRHWYEPGVPLLLGVGAALFIVGILWALLDINLMFFLLLLPIAATIMGVALSQSAPAAQRFVLGVPFIAIFVALPLGLLSTWLRTQWPERKWVTAVPALLLTGWLVFSNLNFYFTTAYNSFILGGTNTVVATELAQELQRQPPGDVYFFGFPRMGYRSHSTVPYLAPQMNGMDVVEPLAGPWKTYLTRPTWFVFLPERLNELDFVREVYPQGSYREFPDPQGGLLFALFAVE